MAKNNILEITDTFEFTNKACEAETNIIHKKNNEREYSFSLFPNDKSSKRFKYFKSSARNPEEPLNSDKRADEMKFLLIESDENDKKIDLITEFTFLSSKDRLKHAEDNRARDIQKFINKYGFFFDIKEYCVISIDDIVAWSERLNKFAFLYCEVMNWKSHRECDFCKVFNCVMYFLTAGEMSTALGNDDVRSTYVFDFFWLMSSYIVGLPCLNNEQEVDDEADYEGDAEDDYGLYDGPNDDMTIARIKEARELGEEVFEHEVLFNEKQIKKLMEELIKNIYLLEDEKQFKDTMLKMGCSGLHAKIKDPREDIPANDRIMLRINEMKQFILNTYILLKKHKKDVITQKTIAILVDLMKKKLDVEKYLVSIIAPQLNIIITDEMVEATKSVEKFMADEIKKYDLADELIELAELVIHRIVNNQLRDLSYEYNYKNRGFELHIDDLYTAMVLAICNIDKDWKYRKCENCGCAFLIKRTNTNKKNCDKCKK